MDNDNFKFDEVEENDFVEDEKPAKKEFKLDDDTVEKEFKLDDDEEEKEKKKLNINFNPKIVIIVLICISVLLFILLMVSMNKNSKLIKQNNTGLDVGDNSVEVLDVTSEEVQNIFSNVTGTISNYCHKETAYFTDSKNTIANLSDEAVYGVVMNKIVNKDKISGNITRRLVHSEIEKMFGSNYKFEDKTFTTYPLYDYVEESATYVPSNKGKKFNSSVCDLYRIVKAYKQGDDFYVYAKVLFATADNNGVHYYNDYRHSSELTGLDKNSNGALLANDRNFSKGGLFEMKFKLDSNDNYVFEYSQPTR